MSTLPEPIHLPEPQKEILERLWPPTVSQYACESVSENTRRAYRSDLTHFFAWGGSLPSSIQQVICYLEDHAKSHSIRTLRRRVATLNEAHRLLGVASPADSSEVRRVLRGIARVEGVPAKQAPPLMVEQACTIIRHLDGSVAGVRDKALILVGWALFLRRSELVTICREHIAMKSDRAIITLNRSKTDQEARGSKLSLPRMNGPACPVTALQAWLALSGITSGPVFRRVYKGGSVASEEHGLTAHSVNLILKRRALEAGVDEALLFSGHSLRRGGITQAYATDCTEADIQRVSRHRSLIQLRDYRDASVALMGDQPSQEFLQALNAQLLAPSPSLSAPD